MIIVSSLHNVSGLSIRIYLFEEDESIQRFMNFKAFSCVGLISVWLTQQQWSLGSIQVRHTYEMSSVLLDAEAIHNFSTHSVAVRLLALRVQAHGWRNIYLSPFDSFRTSMRSQTPNHQSMQTEHCGEVRLFSWRRAFFFDCEIHFLVAIGSTMEASPYWVSQREPNFYSLHLIRLLIIVRLCDREIT